jgi:hypothetical protein
MIVYIVVSETELIDCTTHSLHCITENYTVAENIFESVEKTEKAPVILYKMETERTYDFELFGLSKDKTIEIMKAHPPWHALLSF